MAQILVLTKEVPLPLQATGATLRINPVLRHLARDHAVDLVLLHETRPDAEELIAEAETFCRSVRRIPRPEVGTVTRLSRTVAGMLDPSRPPWEMLDPFSEERVDAVARILDETAYDAILAIEGALDVVGRLSGRRSRPPRVIVDWIDAPSLVLERRIRGLTPLKARIVRSRARQLIAWQRKLNAKVEAAVYIADLDRAHSGADALPHVHVIPNGVLRRDESFERSEGGPPTLGFLGNMSYGPNVRAAERLHDDIFQPLRATHPDLRLKIVGRAPAPSLLERNGPGVEITGEVESIWPHLGEIDVMVFPMTLGGGLQNKVLEAVEAGCAVVVTHVGAAGLGERYLDDLIIRESDEEIREAVRELIDDPTALARARERVGRIRDAFDWETILPRFEAVIVGSDQAPPAG